MESKLLVHFMKKNCKRQIKNVKNEAVRLIVKQLKNLEKQVI